MKKNIMLGAMLLLCTQADAMNNASAGTSLEHLENIRRAVGDGANANTLMTLLNGAIEDVANYANPADGANKAVKKLIDENCEKNPRLAEIYRSIAKKRSPANEYKGNGIFRSNSQDDLVNYVKTEGQKTYAQEVDVQDEYENWLDVMDNLLNQFSEYKTSTGVNLTPGQISKLDELDLQLKNLRNPTVESSNSPGNTEKKSNAVESRTATSADIANKSDIEANNGLNILIANFIRAANETPNTIFANIQNIRNELNGNLSILNEENRHQFRDLITRAAIRPDLVDHLENLTGGRRYFSRNSVYPCGVIFHNDQYATILAHVAAWCYGSENLDTDSLEHDIDSLDVRECYEWVKPHAFPGDPLEVLAHVSLVTNVALKGIIDDLDVRRYPVDDHMLLERHDESTTIDILNQNDQITVLSAMLFAMLNAYYRSGRFFFHEQERDKNRFKTALKAITGRLIVLLAI